jgi:hypothetical protein
MAIPSPPAGSGLGDTLGGASSGPPGRGTVKFSMDEPAGAGVGDIERSTLAITDKSEMSYEEEGAVRAKLRELGREDETWVFELADVFKGAKSKAASRTRFRILVFAIFAMVVFLLLNVLGNLFTRSWSTTEAGSLVVGWKTPAAVSRVVELHELGEYAELPIEVLKRVEDVAFTHNGVVHYFKIASFRKYSDSKVILVSPERSIITIEDGSVKYNLPFETEQYVDEAQPKELRGTFTMQIHDPEFTTTDAP